MKKSFLFLLPSLLSVLFLSCSTKQEQKTETAYTVEQVSTGDHVEVFKTNLGHIIRDSIGFGPQNERIDITDSKGRPLAVAGKASEADVFTFVKYLF